MKRAFGPQRRAADGHAAGRVGDPPCGGMRLTARPEVGPYRVPRARRMIASALRSTSAVVVAQELTLMRIAVRPCQTVTPAQQVPSAWMASITRLVLSASPKVTRTWFS